MGLCSQFSIQRLGVSSADGLAHVPLRQPAHVTTNNPSPYSGSPLCRWHGPVPPDRSPVLALPAPPTLGSLHLVYALCVPRFLHPLTPGPRSFTDVSGPPPSPLAGLYSEQVTSGVLLLSPQNEVAALLHLNFCYVPITSHCCLDHPPHSISVCLLVCGLDPQQSDRSRTAVTIHCPPCYLPPVRPVPTMGRHLGTLLKERLGPSDMNTGASFQRLTRSFKETCEHCSRDQQASFRHQVCDVTSQCASLLGSLPVFTHIGCFPSPLTCLQPRFTSHSVLCGAEGKVSDVRTLRTRLRSLERLLREQRQEIHKERPCAWCVLSST